MVLKAKSDNTIQPLRNVKDFTAWVLPSLDSNSAPGFKQPIEEVVEDPKVVAAKLAKAQAEELKALKESAFKQGFDSGQTAGLAAAKQQIETLANTYKSLIDDLDDPIKQCGEKTQQQLLQLAFAIARQIVRRELKQDPSQLIAIIREALKLLPVSTQKIEITLHPDDATMIRNTLAIDTESDSSRWKIKEDPVTDRGSCLVSTKNSKIDASIDKQVAILFNRLVGGLRSGEQIPHFEIETSSSLETIEPKTGVDPIQKSDQQAETEQQAETKNESVTNIKSTTETAKPSESIISPNKPTDEAKDE